MERTKGGPRLVALAAALIGLSVAACGSGNGSTPGSAADETPQADTPAVAQEAAPAPGKAWVIFGSDTVDAEVARTADERAKGLMYRDTVPPGTGMLFVFDQLGPQSFWMANTYVPLAIAFMDASYTVVDIQQMEPLTTDSHESGAPALFALEVPAGWFAAHGIEVGTRATVEFGAQLGS